jgi:hypothetical protein
VGVKGGDTSRGRVYVVSVSFLSRLIPRSLNVPAAAILRSDEYWVNRQEVLMAIHRAVKSHRIQYAYSGPYRGATGGPSTSPQQPQRDDGVRWGNGDATATSSTILPSS